MAEIGFPSLSMVGVSLQSASWFVDDMALISDTAKGLPFPNLSAGLVDLDFSKIL